MLLCPVPKLKRCWVFLEPDNPHSFTAKSPIISCSGTGVAIVIVATTPIPSQAQIPMHEAPTSQRPAKELIVEAHLMELAVICVNTPS